MYHYYILSWRAFLAHYHNRSDIETVYAMINGKFGDSVRGKSNTAQTNEVLSKAVCRNNRVLVQNIHELAIEPVLRTDTLTP